MSTLSSMLRRIADWLDGRALNFEQPQPEAEADPHAAALSDLLVINGPSDEKRLAWVLAADLAERFDGCSLGAVIYYTEDALKILRHRTRVSALSVVIPEVKDGVLQASYFE